MHQGGISMPSQQTGRAGRASAANGSSALDGAQDVAQRVLAGAEHVAGQVPDVIAGAGSYAQEAQETLEAMPNQALIVGSSFSVGLAIGLLIGGSPRTFIVLALIPGAAMAMTLLTRQDATRPATTSAGRRQAART
jgi:hypothetical protein